MAKLDGADGGHVWSARYGTVEGIHPLRLAADAAGDVLVIGRTSGVLDLGSGPLEGGYIMKLDGVTGAHVWSKPVAVGDVDPRVIAVDGAGDLVLAGEYTGTIDLGSGPLSGDSLADVFMAKLDPAGGHRWSKGFAAPHYQRVRGVATDSADHVFFAGVFHNEIDLGGGPLVSAGFGDVFAVKLSP